MTISGAASLAICKLPGVAWANVSGRSMGTVSGVSRGVAGTDRRLVLYGALTATVRTGLDFLVAPSVLYLAVNAING